MVNSNDDGTRDEAGHVKVERAGDVDILSLIGTFEVEAVMILDSTLRALIERGTRKLIVDLTIASYMVSTAFRSILNAQVRLNLVGGMLRVVCPSTGAIRRVIRMTQLDGVLDIFETRNSALDRFE